jgi:hypothetical protein
MAKKTRAAGRNPGATRLASRQKELDKALHKLFERYAEEKVPGRIVALVDKLEVALKRHLYGGTSLAARTAPQRKPKKPRSSH